MNSGSALNVDSGKTWYIPLQYGYFCGGAYRAQRALEEGWGIL